ncbi:c-type cytochrome [Roseovarius salinarum]|uniref:c-type cytochrome n=1 Tax=Roseovarius salinarum TaxID=1981892 RepID=UPI000C3280CD|nr:c-type cytochrome [Roseovarius salinarum]
MRAAVAGILFCLVAAGATAAREFTTLKGHGGPVMGISVNPRTGQVATASFDNSVGLWRSRSPRWLEGHAAAVNTVLFASPGRVLSAADDFAVIDWNLATGEKTRLTGHKGKVVALDLSPDGRWIASASWDGTIGLWPAKGQSGKPRFLDDHDNSVTDVAFAPDGQGLYSGSADGTIRYHRLGEAGSDSRVIVDQGFGINCFVLAPDMGWIAYGAVDGATRVIHPRTGALVQDFTLDRRPILALAHHPETRRLAVGDGHGYVMMIDTARWRIARDFRAMRSGPVWALGFSPDGEMIYAGGLDDVAYAWPVGMLDQYEPAGKETRGFLRDPDEMPNGERQFMRKCSICHALTPPPSRKAGPTLHGLFGRRAGTVPGYSYSGTLTGSDIIWSDETIDALFELGPDHYVPGSKMPMQRINSADDRQDLIEFLRKASAPGEE